MFIHPKVPEFTLIKLLQTSGTLTFSLHWWPVTWCAPRCFEAEPVVRLQWGGHNVGPQRSQRWASLFITYGYLWWIYYDNLWHSCIYPRYLQLHGWNRMSYYMNFRNPLENWWGKLFWMQFFHVLSVFLCDEQNPKKNTGYLWISGDFGDCMHQNVTKIYVYSRIWPQKNLQNLQHCRHDLI
jgi:hypothetical protein